MNDARRTLIRWLLSAVLEQGATPRRAPTLRVPRLERPLSAAECRQLVGPLSRLRFLPPPQQRL